jgi:Ca2+-binding RTX toxin-like protein
MVSRQLGTANDDTLVGDGNFLDLSDLILGFGGDDAMAGLSGNDTLEGGDGDDLLVGGIGNDSLVGGRGDDLLGDLFSNRGFSADIFNEIGDDELDGGDGDDYIGGGEGSDVVLGGNGDDRMGSFRLSTTRAGSTETSTRISLDPGNDRLEGGEGRDCVSGGNGDDRVLGNGGIDLLGAYSINLVNVDLIDEQGQIINFSSSVYTTDEAGNDVLEGGDGADYLSGGEGNDELLGGNDADILGSYSAIIRAIPGGIGPSSGQQNGFDPGNDRLDGGEGDDFLCGGEGDDVLQGGNGNDILGSFSLTRRTSASAARFDSSGTVEDNSSYDRVISATDDVGNDIQEGGRGNDTLNGGTGNDQLVGVSQADGLLAGFNEVDTLRGGTGSDIFVLGNTSTVFYNDRRNRTRGRQDYALIQDFAIVQGDRIQLQGRRRNYKITPSSSVRNATEILLKTGRSTELIAVVQGSSFTNFNQGFVFV